MPNRIELPVAGGCPQCGSIDVAVPEKYDRDTIVKCEACGHEAFFDKPDVRASAGGTEVGNG